MPDKEKVIERLSDLKERLKWQKDIQGYGFYIDFIDDALALLKKQQHKIWELNEINEYLDDVKKDQEHQIDVLKEQFDKDIIVRCKDCKAWKQYDDMNLGECELFPEYNKMGEWFCNFGERKEGR